MVADLALALERRQRARAHAEPKRVPLLRARLQVAVAVDVVELAAERLAVEGLVEGVAARHGARVDRCGRYVEGAVGADAVVGS